MIQASCEAFRELHSTAKSEEALPLGRDDSNEDSKNSDLNRDGSISERELLGLTQDLEDLVLARLPVAILYRIRPVCKRWNSLLTHRPFLALRNEIQGKRTKVYDSETGLWSKRGRPTPNLALAKHIGAYSDGVLYCVAREERSGMWGVVKYHVEGARTWSDLIFFPSQHGETCVKAKVVEFGDEIFALVEKEISEDDIGAKTKSLSLWKLEKRTSLQWRLAGVMPTLLRQQLLNLDEFDCVPFNNRLCIVTKSTSKAVACFISSGTVRLWKEFSLDSYFSVDAPLVERCIVPFAFEPSLLVSV